MRSNASISSAGSYTDGAHRSGLDLDHDLLDRVHLVPLGVPRRDDRLAQAPLVGGARLKAMLTRGRVPDHFPASPATALAGMEFGDLPAAAGIGADLNDLDGTESGPRPAGQTNWPR